GEIPGGEKIRKTLEDAIPLVVGKTLGEYKNVLTAVRNQFADRAQALLLPQIDSLIARGAQAIIMGCTEIPLIVAGHERAIACPM
ncbi:aspartate/glutamate racemase family protein, partial [Salmonella enterica subsp. enterica serovar Cerro]|nr:aspartate/glutamate racemase family protein [Salmonella enterica subsp. enterica serovar Cerro]